MYRPVLKSFFDGALLSSVAPPHAAGDDVVIERSRLLYIDAKKHPVTQVHEWVEERLKAEDYFAIFGIGAPPCSSRMMNKALETLNGPHILLR